MRAVGPPASPIPFPKEPRFIKAKRITTPVHVPIDDKGVDETKKEKNAETNESTSARALLQRNDSMAGNVLVCLKEGGENSERAYWIQRKLAKTTYGSVRVGYVLRHRENVESDGEDEMNEEARDDTMNMKHNKRAPRADLGKTGGQMNEEQSRKRPKTRKSMSDTRVQWEVTPASAMSPSSITNGGSSSPTQYEMVAIKTYEKSKISALCGRRMENPTVELAVLQLIAQAETKDHVLGANDILADDRFIYCMLPYNGDGDLFNFVEGRGRLEEGVARHFFRQILKGLGLFQRIGICHRNLSLENVLINGTNCNITGMGMCLRVPYTSSSDNDDSTTDASSGTMPRLIKPQGQCGRPHYMAPEILSNDRSFDGYAVDMWAAGVMLFHMLFGHPPFVWAASDDPRFHLIAINGNLRSFVQKWLEEGLHGKGDSNRSISDEAVDLLQKMLRIDPEDRFTLEQVAEHAWVACGEDDKELLATMLPTPKNIDGI